MKIKEGEGCWWPTYEEPEAYHTIIIWFKASAAEVDLVRSRRVSRLAVSRSRSRSLSVQKMTRESARTAG